MKKEKKRSLNIKFEKGIEELQSKVKKIDAKHKRKSGGGDEISKKSESGEDKQNKQQRLQKRLNIQKLLSSIIIILIIIIIIGTIGYILYTILDMFSDVRVGDYVLKKDEVSKYGVIKDFFTPLVAVIQWNNGKISREFIFNIQKITKFDEDTIKDIIMDDSGAEYFPVDNRNKLIDYFNHEDLVVIDNNDKNCVPKIFCENWTSCEIFFDLSNLIDKNVSLGHQTRVCKDLNSCLSNFIQTKDCNTGEKIVIRKDRDKDNTNLNIYDDAGELVVEIKLNKTNIDNPYLILKVH